MTRQMLMDNVYLTHIPSDKFKTSYFSAQMAAPMRAGTAGLNALLVNVLSRGSTRLPDIASLGRELDMLYGARLGPSLRRVGENQVFGFSASCVDERFLPRGEGLLEKIADLMGDMFCDPATQGGRLRGDYVESEREKLADEIRSAVNDKRAYAARRLLEVMCAGESYGLKLMGEAADMERVSLQKLNSHYQSVLPQGRLELFYCGSAPERRLAGAFRRAFARLPRKGGLEPVPTVSRPARPEYQVVTEEMDISQGKLGMGFRTESGDVPANLVMDAMFGGTSTSKLFLNVREKLSLCYYAGSRYHRLKGLVTVSSGIDCQHYDRAVEEITAQLEALRRGDWEPWEFEGAVSSLRNGLRSMEDSAGALEDFYIGQAVSGLDETIPDLLAAIGAVTPQRVQAAAEELRLDTIYFLKGQEAQA